MGKSNAEENAILDKVRNLEQLYNSRNRYKPSFLIQPIMTMYYTGMREGELCSFTAG